MDNPSNTICSNLVDFPVGQFGTTGVGLVDNQWPFLVCGGCSQNAELNKNCYSYGFNPEPVAKLSESRCLASRWFSVRICTYKPGYKSHDLL